MTSVAVSLRYCFSVRPGIHCTTIAILGLDVPPLHYMIAVTGGDVIKCAPYATFGTEALSHNAVEALGKSNACLLANHGVIVTGRSVAEAFYDLYYLEVCCQEQFTLVSSGAEPRLIPQDVVALTRSQFADVEDGGAELYFEALKRRLDIEEPDYRA